MTDEQIRRIYNSFPSEQTMSFQEFRKEMQDLTSSSKMQEDLAEIQMQKAVFNTNKIRIDKNL